MCKSTNLKVFISGPSDVSIEKDAAQRAINRLNNIWGDHFNIVFTSFEWTTQTHSSITGNNDGQEIIDEQVGKDYHVYIGIMWMKYGTETNIHGSGTVQEFYNALEIRDEKPDDFDILFYFGNKGPNLMDEIKTEEYQKVTNFRNELRQMGLYKKYNSTEHF